MPSFKIPSFDKFISAMGSRQLYVHVLLIQVSRLEVLRVLLY